MVRSASHWRAASAYWQPQAAIIDSVKVTNPLPQASWQVVDGREELLGTVRLQVSHRLLCAETYVWQNSVHAAQEPKVAQWQEFKILWLHVRPHLGPVHRRPDFDSLEIHRLKHKGFVKKSVCLFNLRDKRSHAKHHILEVCGKPRICAFIRPAFIVLKGSVAIRPLPFVELTEGRDEAFDRIPNKRKKHPGVPVVGEVDERNRRRCIFFYLKVLDSGGAATGHIDVQFA